MPYWLDFNTNVIQIMGGSLLHLQNHTLCGSMTTNRSPLVPKTNGYFNQMCHIYFFSAIALAFCIHDKTNIKNQFLGEIYVLSLFYLPVPGW